VTERPDWKIVAIPTTSGTGSEISNGAVFIDESIQSKFPVISMNVCPDVALTDPEMTLSMPPKVTANSGVDALVHAAESYISKNAGVATEPFAIRAIELIGEGLKPAYANGDDLDAREVMQIGATMAMVSAMNALLGLCHAMAMPLCALYHIPHGQACGLVLPAVLEFNAEVRKEKVANIFKAMGIIDKDAGPDALRSDCYEQLKAMLNEIGVMTKLSDHGYEEAHVETIVKGTINSVQTQFNPRTPNEADIADIVSRVI
jgi:alcohol dehydrogenase